MVPAPIWLLAKAIGNAASIPMTSPVDFISGPSSVSTFGKRANGKTASLTEICFSFGCSELEIGEPGAGHDLGGDLGNLDADRLCDEGHGARGARIDLEDVDVAVLHRVLHVHQPADLKRLGERDRLPLDLGDDRPRQRMRRQRAGGIAGMDSGFLDMLHHAADEDVLSVGERIDIDLDRIGEIGIDQHRRRAGDDDGIRHVAFEAPRIAHDLHGAAAEHVGGTDHDRVADPLDDFPRLLGRARSAVLGLPQAQAARSES